MDQKSSSVVEPSNRTQKLHDESRKDTQPKPSSTRQSKLRVAQGVLQLSTSKKVDVKPSFPVYEDPKEIISNDEHLPKAFVDTEAQTKLTAPDKDEASQQNIRWTIALDGEALKWKELAQRREQYLKECKNEQDQLQMRNFELNEEKYNLERDKEGYQEIIEKAKKISEYLDPLLNSTDDETENQTSHQDSL